MNSSSQHITWLSGLAVAAIGVSALAAELKITMPLARTDYQTNERIDFTLMRPAATPAELRVTVSGADGATMVFTFPTTRAVEHLHLNGWLLRPGKYTVSVTDGTASGKTELEVFNHVRRSSYRLINWGRASEPAEQLRQGEAEFGFNLFYGSHGDDQHAALLRAGLDYMHACTMSGGHQMDLRLECDWSDPYVLRGGTQRMSRRAFMDRTRGNVIGVHAYDEPGLTWWKDPATEQLTPHGVPAQMRAYEAAWGRKLIDYKQVNPNNPAHVAEWTHWARWKLGFMEAAWRETRFGVEYIRPDFLTATQSQYGWGAPTDGYYFNIARSLPVVSGHGGYHDFGLAYFNPSFFLEMARARDLTLDCWYLPTWYGDTTDDQYRLEQYLSFQTGIEGLMSPPDLEPARNASARAAIIESNRLMGRLGTIFNTMPVTRPPVAMLYSLSDFIAAQIADRNINYVNATPQYRALELTYLAGKQLQHQFLPIVEEDVLDGTLAAHHRAVIVCGVRHLDPAVVTALEQFIAEGGLVLLAGECTVSIKGAIDLGVRSLKLPDEDSEPYKAAVAARKWELLEPYQTAAKWMQAATPLARAIKAQLDKVGIRPIFQCDAPGIVATRHAEGDIEYFFAVNATPDPNSSQRNAMTTATATIELPAQGKTVYDAVRGGPAKAKDQYDFGNGEMRVWAVTARPIGAVSVATPVVSHDLTRTEMPISVRVAATLLDHKGAVLAGSAPMRIQVLDPRGETRYDLHRATKLGTLTLELPLAANDPAGEWKVVVTELLNNTSGQAAFRYQPATRCGPVAGTTRRAVMLARESQNLFRFARVHHTVTIVPGNGDYAAAVKRIQDYLEPWGVKATVMDVATASRPRVLSEKEAPTWVGLQYASSGTIKPGGGNDPVYVGFAVQGPVILVGTPENHPIIKFLSDQKFLPYAPSPGGFPGAGRGYIAWQRDGVGHRQESITLIAYDAVGMDEAVGTLYEAVAGLEPLTPWTLPVVNSIAVK